MLIALAIGVGVGLLYLVLFILLPKIMSYLVFVLCALTLIVAAILLLVQPIKLMAFEGNTWNIIIAIALIILAIFIFAYIFCQKQELELASIFLTYANLFLKENAILFLYIPLFIVLSFGLVVLIIWQFIAFTSINAPTWDAANLFRSITPNLFLVVLNFIEFVWGIQFIRDCRNHKTIQLTTSFRATPSSGTSTSTTPRPFTAQGQSTDSSARTGAALLLDRSSMPSSVYSDWSLTSSTYV